ncbi:galactokinase [Candidatus Planktophila versatilis]|uniref:Galactokinase n=1 Tax=Candidatus Planktophila versatilis TaxID=1884905 RepID=A0ABM6MDI6_9ACTN|nr:galactokinase [Candidatus Planktophila versatilis]ASY16943.1 galactokinase [Candidatus Planktophila versatilis]
MGALSTNFESLYGHKPQVISEAPGRVNLIGEHIDYSDGFVLPFAIADRTHAALAKRSDGLVRIASNQRKNELFTIDAADVKPGSAGEWEKYVLGVIWALKIDSGLDILIDGTVPTGAGLSSSAALECSVAVALNLLFELNISLADLARATQRAENEYVGMPCGIMDQSVSLMAQAGAALLLDCRDLSTQSIPFNVVNHGLELLIIDTQAHHALIDGGYAERRASCESAVAKLGVRSMRELTLDALDAAQDKLTPVEFMRARHAVTEIARVHNAVVALKASDFAELGLLLNGSHNSLRDDYTVSCPELDLAVHTSLAAGALGARMVGGGFGGSAIALIQASDLKKTRTAITDAFISKGFKKPRFFTSLPSQGASAQLLS